MPLKILFADDSMTAQNMGTKILAEAGYEVVAVSNGAAAMKKIAEHKPDIVILDVYMPGYNGLEVCEKLRSSMATLNTPVLLTVGKMEPYRSEDANRVKADGIIIKPFEASDLLSIIKKLEERIAPPPPIAPPATDQTMFLDRPTELMNFQHAAPAQEDITHSGDFRAAKAAPAVEMPNDMGSAAAFGDWLSSETPAISPSTPVEAAAPAAEAATSTRTPAEEPTFPSSWGWSYGNKVPMEEVAAPVQESAPAPSLYVPEAPAIFEAPVVPELVVNELPTISVEPAIPETPTLEVYAAEAPAMAEPAIQTPVIETPIVETPVVPEAPAAFTIEDTQPIEVYQEPSEIPVQAVTEMEMAPAAPDDTAFSLPSAGSLEVFSNAAPASSSETAAASAAYGVPDIDPALATNRSDMASDFATRFGVEQPEEIPVGVWTEPEATIPVESTAEPEASWTAEAAIEAEAAPLAPEPVESLVTPPSETAVAGEATNLTDDDFEARVAAAMAAYDQPLQQEEETAAPQAVELSETTSPLPERSVTSAEPAPSIKMVPEAETIAGAGPHEMLVPADAGTFTDIEPQAVRDPLLEQFGEPDVAVSQTEQPAVADSMVREAAGEIAEHISAAVEHSSMVDSLPLNAGGAKASANPEVIADIVHRVMERIKPLLVEEITRELDIHK